MSYRVCANVISKVGTFIIFCQKRLKHTFFFVLNIYRMLFSWKSGAISAVFGYAALGFPNRKLLTISILVRDELSVSVTAFEVIIVVY